MGGAKYSHGDLCQTLSGHRNTYQRYRAERGHSAMEPLNHHRCQWSAVSYRKKIVSGALVIGYNVINYIKGLTVILRESSIDITRAIGLVGNTRKTLQDVRHRSGNW